MHSDDTRLTQIDDMQFGFMKGKGTTDAIFMARKTQENFRVKGKKLYCVFVDLQKAFHRVPREVISWAMRKLGVEEWLVSAVMSMYTGAKKDGTIGLIRSLRRSAWSQTEVCDFGLSER